MKWISPWGNPASNTELDKLREMLAVLRQANDVAQAERAALLRTIDEAHRARRDAEKLIAEMTFSFMKKVQELRRESRIALEEHQKHESGW